MNDIVTKIEKELTRLDAYDKGQGIVCAAEPMLPRGWVRVYDGTADAYGPGDEILTALREIAYDPDEIVRVEENPVQVDEHTWEDVGEEITASEDHLGFEAAWDALSDFHEDAPETSRSWPRDLIEYRQIEEGTINENPLHLIRIDTNAGPRWTCGPHGVSECVVSNAFAYGGWFSTREEALASYPVDDEE